MIEIKRILCPVDFSAGSERALEFAVATARWYESRITVLHVLPAVVPVDIIPSVVPNPADQIAAREAARRELTAAAAQWVERASGRGVEVELVMDESRSVHRAILDQAQAIGADLIVIGSHGRSGFERFLLGSVTEKVVRQAVCPVLVVPPRAEQLVAAGEAGFDSILCAVDFSDASKAAVEYALSLAQEADAHLTLFHAIEVPPELSQHASAANFDVAQVRATAEAARLEALRALVPASAREFCHVHTEVAEGAAYRTILASAAANQSDLIVMGARGRGAVDRLVFGSNASQVIRAATCPVLIVPGPGEPS